MNIKDYSIKTFIFASALTTFLGLAFYVPSGKAEATDHTAQKQPCVHITGMTHVAVIKDDSITPASIKAQVCDTLVITNQDDRPREIAFGDHDSHNQYSGLGDRIVKSGESITIDLSQVGNYIFHDHFNEKVSARIAVQGEHDNSRAQVQSHTEDQHSSDH